MAPKLLAVAIPAVQAAAQASADLHKKMINQ
jgi:predicted porin